MLPTPSTGTSGRIATGLELTLDTAVLLFLPILTIAPLGVAALAATAGACALGIVLVRGGAASQLLVPASEALDLVGARSWAGRLREPSRKVQIVEGRAEPGREREYESRPQAVGIGVPACLIGMLLGWAALSAIWSINPLRSLAVAARVGGLVIAGFCLLAAAPGIAHPRRLLLCALGGLGLAMVLAIFELASNGVLNSLFFERNYGPVRLNRASVGFAILLLPGIATLIYCRATIVAVPLAGAMIGMVYVLVATIAKFILPIGFAAGALILLSRRIAPALAVLSAVIVLTAPLTFSRLAALPGMIQRADEIKGSAGHRLEIWSFVGQRIAERPVLGWGLDASRAIPGGKELIRPGQSWLPLYPHNGALQVWLELGAPGAAILAALVARLWLGLGRADYPRLFKAAAAGSLVMAMIAGLSNYDIWHEWWIGTLWFILFLVCVMGSVCREAARADALAAMPKHTGSPFGTSVDVVDTPRV